MDKKKKISVRSILLIGVLLFATILNAQVEVGSVEFSDIYYNPDAIKGQNDSITLYLKFLDAQGRRLEYVNEDNIRNFLQIYEGNTLIENYDLKAEKGIPRECTFSILIDLTISPEDKPTIYKSIKEKLIQNAPDSCVFVSFMLNDSITKSRLVTKENIELLEKGFANTSDEQYIYKALCYKLQEFNNVIDPSFPEKMKTINWEFESNIAQRAKLKGHKDKNFLFIFINGNQRASSNEIVAVSEAIEFKDALWNKRDSIIVPHIYAFYFGKSLDDSVNLLLEEITEGNGKYKQSENFDVNDFKEGIDDAMYDFAFTYKAIKGTYIGDVDYTAKWGINTIVGKRRLAIGSKETPWLNEEVTTDKTIIKYLVALLVALLTMVFFIFVMKIVIPYFKSKSFAVKYYKKYVPEANVQRRICHYCKQDIQPGQMVVVKCKHIMHIHCWKQNGYKCAEYGQNCKTGIQEHIEWRELLRMTTIRDCYQAISGILAGLIGWIVFELTGRGLFTSMATSITNIFYGKNDQISSIANTCIDKVSAFLTIGLLLGFFLSLVFRYNDEYRKKDWKVYLKIVLLSILTGIIGMAAFAVGGIIMCSLLSATGFGNIPWYFSFPAYLLFSICTSLSLTIKSSIPIKSAMLGGLCSAVIGFLVLYFSDFISPEFIEKYPWMPMLLNFIIYGGGLGASLVTVRLLAEKYFLVIQNGVKAGQKIPIHKWMNATGGGNKVSIGMTGECEIQMNWEKSNKVAKEHAQLFIDHAKSLPMIKPLAVGVIYNTRAELPVGKPSVLSNGDTFTIGDTIFQYTETD